LPSLGYRNKLSLQPNKQVNLFLDAIEVASGLFQKGFKGVSKDFGLPFAY